MCNFVKVSSKAVDQSERLPVSQPDTGLHMLLYALCHTLCYAMLAVVVSVVGFALFVFTNDGTFVMLKRCVVFYSYPVGQ